MKTLADLKRAIKVGTRLRCLYHFKGKEWEKEREVVKVQTNGFYTYMDKNHKSIWMDFPKSKDVEFNGKMFTVFQNGNKLFVFEVIG